MSCDCTRTRYWGQYLRPVADVQGLNGGGRSQFLGTRTRHEGDAKRANGVRKVSWLPRARFRRDQPCRSRARTPPLSSGRLYRPSVQVP